MRCGEYITSKLKKSHKTQTLSLVSIENGKGDIEEMLTKCLTMNYDIFQVAPLVMICIS